MTIKTDHAVTLSLLLTFFTGSANAALAYNATLSMGPQVTHCFNGSGMPGTCSDYEIPDTNYLAVDYWNPHTNTFTSQDYIFSEDERIALEPGSAGGITLGEAQSPGEIDSGFVFNGIDYYHHSQSAVTIISDDNEGNVVLDMSGLGLWSTEGGSIPLNDRKDVLGLLTCGDRCGNGDTFVLEARSILPRSCSWGPCVTDDDYLFHIEGTISSVPVPAAAWLLISGLIGLTGVAGRRRPGVAH